jgi:hypothetical protein
VPAVGVEPLLPFEPEFLIAQYLQGGSALQFGSRASSTQRVLCDARTEYIQDDFTE